MELDHARLDALLLNSIASNFDRTIYNEFRKGLLRHIAIEEKLLFPTAKSEAKTAKLVARLRLQHGALAALIVPAPNEKIANALKDMLALHNQLEEGIEGVYHTIEHLSDHPMTLLDSVIAYPNVPLSSAIDKLIDLAPVFRAMERAGFEPKKYFEL